MVSAISFPLSFIVSSVGAAALMFYVVDKHREKYGIGENGLSLPLSIFILTAFVMQVGMVFYSNVLDGSLMFLVAFAPFYAPVLIAPFVDSLEH